jgi:hypothetical protein
VTGNSFELGEVLDKKIFWRPRKPTEDSPKDYSINVFFRTYDMNGDEEKIDIARVDYKKEHNRVHFDKFYERPPTRDEYIDWDFWEAWNKLEEGWEEIAEKYLERYGQQQVEIENVRRK